ncbi:flagellar hook-basal body complex protein FliE [Rhodocaloribacter litoris]|uniref:flagellar hook-basal body complex protein FliE n=1 Tax=Rhodocaloribacter litoris TaxID=2558931 RepID=UPI001421DBE2|nr:flagellar hook-basal body complex protein FliE [Rhodocaloribacter litoris]QXD16039.1 flagellar hook-basal body complex protein FliE [Rhodocaloribacter litoris]GIV59767.1 MAG: flagellar hook-basal body complex protein FliE [Rhodothermaceae bacterium]
MTIAELQRMRAVGPAGPDDPRGLPRPRSREGPDGISFGKALQEAVESVDAAQKAADEQVTAFISGEQENVHEVMIAMNQAQLSFQLMTEVRNRMLETYQELMRMQV